MTQVQVKGLPYEPLEHFNTQMLMVGSPNELIGQF